MTKNDAAILANHLRGLADSADGEGKQFTASAYRHAADLVELAQAIFENHEL